MSSLELNNKVSLTTVSRINAGKNLKRLTEEGSLGPKSIAKSRMWDKKKGGQTGMQIKQTVLENPQKRNLNLEPVIQEGRKKGREAVVGENSREEKLLRKENGNGWDGAG